MIDCIFTIILLNTGGVPIQKISTQVALLVALIGLKFQLELVLLYSLHVLIRTHDHQHSLRQRLVDNYMWLWYVFLFVCWKNHNCTGALSQLTSKKRVEIKAGTNNTVPE